MNDSALPVDPFEEARRCVRDLLATPEPFRRWLESKGDDRVGTAGLSNSCPIQRFIRGECGSLLPIGDDNLTYSVDVRRIVASDWERGIFGRKHEIIHTPQWAREFIARVDGLGQVQVEGSRALQILDNPDQFRIAYNIPPVDEVSPEQVSL